MSDQFSNAQQIRKPAVVSKGGVVAADSVDELRGNDIVKRLYLGGVV